jgi:hypothetical protein
MTDPYTRLPIRVKRKNKRAAMEMIQCLLLLILLAAFFTMCAVSERYLKGG